MPDSVRRLRSLSLRARLTLATTALLAVLALIGLALLQGVVRPSLEDELEVRGVAVSRELAARSTDAALLTDAFALSEIIQDALRTNREVRYVFVVGPGDKVLAHSFEQGLPTDLLALPQPHPGQPQRMELLATEEGIVRDIAVPMYGGKAGFLHVGLTEKYLAASLARLEALLLLAAGFLLILGIGLSYVMANWLTRPLATLTRAAQGLARGEFQPVAPGGGDEMARLAVAFNTMARDIQESHDVLRRRNQELSALNEMRGGFLARVISAQEEERRRVARELHDETSQSLTSLLVGLKAVESSSTLEAAQASITFLRQQASEAFDNVRSLAFQLRPSVLDDLGLLPALRSYARLCQERFHLPVRLEARGLDDRLPGAVETALYRVVQEALTNAARHARASEVAVTLARNDGHVTAVIRDNGVGFDPDSARDQRPEALGLAGMVERVSLMGGKLAIRSQLGRGTTITAEVPVSKESNL